MFKAFFFTLVISESDVVAKLLPLQCIEELVLPPRLNIVNFVKPIAQRNSHVVKEYGVVEIVQLR